MFDKLVDLLHKILYRLPELLLVAVALAIAVFAVLGRLMQYLDYAVIIFGSVIISSLFLMWIRKIKGDVEVREEWLFSFNQKRLTIIFVIFSCILLTANLLVDGRPFYLLILHGILYGIIIFQIFSKECKSTVILIELMVTTAFLLIPQMFGVAFYYGCGDVLPHTRWTYIISETGNISELLGDYFEYFTYHVLSSMLSQVGMVAENQAIYAVSISAYLIAVVFVYYLFKSITKTRYIPLVGVFLYITSNVLLFNFLKPAPRIMASVGFVILLYLIFRKFQVPIVSFILGALVSIYVILTHHAQTPVFLFVLVLLCAGSLLYQNRVFNGNKIIYLTYLTSVIIYFIYTYFNNIINIINKWVTPYLQSGEVQADSMVTADPDISFIFLQPIFQNIFIIFLGLLGLYLLVTNTPRNSQLITIIPFSIVAFLFVPTMIEAIPGMGGFSIYRWRMVLIILFALLMALGVSYLISTLAKRSRKYKKTGTMIVTGICIAIVITSPLLLNTMDNEIQYSDAFTPKEYFYFDSDIALFNYMSENIAYDSKIYSDREHRAYAYHSGTSSIYLPYYKFGYLIPEMFTERGATLNTDYLIYPKERFFRVGLWVTTGSDTRELVEATGDNAIVFNQNIYQYSSIYNNGDSINLHQ